MKLLETILEKMSSVSKAQKFFVYSESQIQDNSLSYTHKSLKSNASLAKSPTRTVTIIKLSRHSSMDAGIQSQGCV
ncbi:MAG: hypothetical protein QX189_13905 [Methylococcales bacterium]